MKFINTVDDAVGRYARREGGIVFRLLLEKGKYLAGLAIIRKSKLNTGSLTNGTQTQTMLREDTSNSFNFAP